MNGRLSSQLANRSAHRYAPGAFVWLETIHRPRETPVWKLEDSLGLPELPRPPQRRPARPGSSASRATAGLRLAEP
jgi:hypothetical protein